jgi:hypothetical protein
MKDMITLFPLAHYVTMLEACPHITWVALLAAVPLAVLSGVIFGRKMPRSLLIVLGTWCGIMAVYYVGVRIYILSKPGGYWCEKACLENLRIIDEAKNKMSAEPAGGG